MVASRYAELPQVSYADSGVGDQRGGWDTMVDIADRLLKQPVFSHICTTYCPGRGRQDGQEYKARTPRILRGRPRGLYK